MDVSPNRDAALADFRVGSHVMVRRRMTSAEIAENVGTLHEKTTLTDVIGEVTNISSSHITVQAKAATVSIEITEIVAAKVIPATIKGRRAPHRSISVKELEEISSAGWHGGEEEKLGSWALRYAGGYTSRANSCLALGSPDMPLSHALDAVKQWYTSREAKPCVQLPLDQGVHPHSDPLIIEAATYGWHAGEEMAVMTAAAHEVHQATKLSPNIHTVWSDLTDAWWSLADERMLANEKSAHTVLTGAHDQRFITIFDGETSIARARMTIQTPWAGLFALYTRPEYRGTGIATHILHECASLALAAGAPSLYLQVVASNDAAIRLYEKTGFRVHHRDAYLEPVTA